MKKFTFQISRTEYAQIEVEVKDAQEAEKLMFEDIDFANWGNDETEIIDLKEE